MVFHTKVETSLRADAQSASKLELNSFHDIILSIELNRFIIKRGKKANDSFFHYCKPLIIFASIKSSWFAFISTCSYHFFDHTFLLTKNLLVAAKVGQTMADSAEFFLRVIHLLSGSISTLTTHVANMIRNTKVEEKRSKKLEMELLSVLMRQDKV